jgi:hypothetical protein
MTFQYPKKRVGAAPFLRIAHNEAKYGRQVEHKYVAQKTGCHDKRDFIQPAKKHNESGKLRQDKFHIILDLA